MTRNVPVEAATKQNLLFLIGLRHEIEHQMSPNIDSYLPGRYQACAMNLNHYARRLFGDGYALDEYL